MKMEAALQRIMAAVGYAVICTDAPFRIGEIIGMGDPISAELFNETLNHPFKIVSETDAADMNAQLAAEGFPPYHPKPGELFYRMVTD